MKNVLCMSPIYDIDMVKMKKCIQIIGSTRSFELNSIQGTLLMFRRIFIFGNDIEKLKKMLEAFSL